MYKFKFNLVLTILSSLALFSGCASNHNPQVQMSGNTNSLRNLKVSNLHSIKLDNLFKAQATIQNTNTFTTAQVYYRCNFFDQALFKIDENQQWVPVQIMANQSEVIQCSTTNPDAATFKVELSSSGNALDVNY